MKACENIVALEARALAAAEEGRYEDALLRHCWALKGAQELDLPEHPALIAVLFERLGQVLEAKGNVQD